MHKSEVLLREAMKEAGEVLRDAVKVIPPEEAGSSRASPGLVWDGTDMWMLPSEPSDSSLSASKTTDPGSSSRQDDSQRAVATRAESLLRRLKHDPAILRHDPEADLGVRDIYYKWLDVEIESKTGGIGGEEWVAKISAVSSEPGDGQALKNTRDALGGLIYNELTVLGNLRPLLYSTFRTHDARLLEAVLFPSPPDRAGRAEAEGFDSR